VDKKYLTQSVDTLLEFGVRLAHTVWLKLLRSEAEQAMKALNEVAFELITQRRYGLASRLLNYGLGIKKDVNERMRKVMTINYANSVKLSGSKDESLKILDKEDWSAARDDFQICLLAIKDDVEGVTRMMTANPSIIGAKYFRTWPVFEPMRSSSEFIEAFFKAFGEPLVKKLEKQGMPVGQDDPNAGGQTTRDSLASRPMEDRI
jgi:hypothetical protein